MRRRGSVVQPEGSRLADSPPQPCAAFEVKDQICFEDEQRPPPVGVGAVELVQIGYEEAADGPLLSVIIGPKWELSVNRPVSGGFGAR